MFAMADSRLASAARLLLKVDRTESALWAWEVLLEENPESTEYIKATVQAKGGDCGESPVPLSSLPSADSAFLYQTPRTMLRASTPSRFCSTCRPSTPARSRFPVSSSRSCRPLRLNSAPALPPTS